MLLEVIVLVAGMMAARYIVIVAESFNSGLEKMETQSDSVCALDHRVGGS